MKYFVTLAAAIEIPTGVLSIFEPSIFTKLLFAGEMSGPGNALGPLAGFGSLRSRLHASRHGRVLRQRHQQSVRCCHSVSCALSTLPIAAYPWAKSARSFGRPLPATPCWVCFFSGIG
jgi:hypothetical protein